MLPETRYTTSDGVSVAYQVVGAGPRDVVLMSPFWSQIEHVWELPSCERFLRRLASFCRLIMFDKRGSGLSDRLSGTPSAEDRMDDIRAVMEAVGSARAMLLGVSEGGTLCALFAATYPERVDALMIYAGAARFTPAPDYPWGITDANRAAFDEYLQARWGSGEMLALVAPSLATDAALVRWFGQLERLTGPPSAVRDLFRWNMEIDVRSVLSTIHAPTLVIHRIGDVACEIGHGRSSPASTASRIMTACSPRCCSPTSSGLLRMRPRWGTASGVICSKGTIRLSGESSAALEGAR